MFHCSAVKKRRLMEQEWTQPFTLKIAGSRSQVFARNVSSHINISSSQISCVRIANGGSYLIASGALTSSENGSFLSKESGFIFLFHGFAGGAPSEKFCISDLPRCRNLETLDRCPKRSCRNRRRTRCMDRPGFCKK